MCALNTTALISLRIIHCLLPTTGNRAAGLLYRARFNAAVRYGVGDMVLDLNEIEHALLRMNLFGISFSYIGNVGRQVRPFPPEDPRSKLALRSPPANISFGLCCVTATAPPLYVFKDPALVYTHLDLLAANYLGTRIGLIAICLQAKP